jgi:phosphoribosyl 1,2-cyclic phosphate phosphodiesterase
MKFSVEFLGSGTSVGVPCIGCDCAVCRSSDPLNRRLRSSVLVRGYDATGNVQTTVVVDTSPDFREQMLRAKVQRLDAVLITHYHADHVVGIDDVRRFNYLQKQVLDCWATSETIQSIRRSFEYVLVEEQNLRFGLPCLKAREMKYGEPFQIGCLTFLPIEMDHYVMKTAGLVTSCGNSAKLAYCLDVKTLPPHSYQMLEGVDTLVLDMLREKEHPTHLNFAEAMAVVGKVKPRRTFFGHIAHEVEHRSFESRLPPEIRLAYDGLIVEMD